MEDQVIKSQGCAVIMDSASEENAAEQIRGASEAIDEICVSKESCAVVMDSGSEENAAEKIEGSSESLDENSASKDSCVDQEHTLPILQKMSNLSTKIQDLKKEHILLSNEVKDITSDPFPGPEVFNTLRVLSNDYELLMQKFLKESAERKRLYNEVIELKGNIRVFCRCRPLNEAEITKGSSQVVEFDSSEDNELQVVSSDSSKKMFKFDHVFKPDDTQETVFAQTKPIVTSVMDGYNVCIFAYGQTGTGKTFTMEGIPGNRGVNYRTLEELFQIAEERSGVMRYELLVSMVEVYNEKIRDLLVDKSNQPAKKLEIKQATDGTQEVPGLVETRVNGTEEVWELLKYGNRARSVGSTSANEQSSRSHCLLRVTVKGESLINGQRTKSHLWMVDLAGSERVSRTEVEGDRLKESQFINKSLSAFGDVIAALASKSSHVPYRNSKLTHMLQSSLGGDCKTVMFLQVSPSSSDLVETLSSLNFASRVRGVESGPVRKQPDFSELLKYKQMAEKLQEKLASRDVMCSFLKEKVRDLENQLAQEKRTRSKQDTRTEKRPPLGPSGVRLPLRRISNFIPPVSPVASRKANTAIVPSVTHGKENLYKQALQSKDIGSSRGKDIMKPRRCSMAVRPASTQVLQPRRRASVATLPTESKSNIPRPFRAAAFQNINSTANEKESFLKRHQNAGRYSFALLPEFKSGAEATPSASSRKFMRSPPTQAASWKKMHPAAITLSRKPVVFSPLKRRTLGIKAFRKSLAQ